ncbi:hypothetical protein LSAT2_032355 [Lamellibrachia satsuma]|nr:hypothetical protein LSAT2_032355 [Lamellibrachia satsuma]
MAALSRNVTLVARKHLLKLVRTCSQPVRCLNLQEFQSKKLMADNGIAVQRFQVAKSQAEAENISKNFKYHTQYARKTAVRWECSNCVAFSYKAAITTDLEMKTVTSSTPHTHDPHDTAVSATKLRTTMREHAGRSRGTLTQLLTDITSDAPIEVRAELSNPETIKQSLHREHAKHLPKNPNSVGDLVLEDEWTKTSTEINS